MDITPRPHLPRDRRDPQLPARRRAAARDADLGQRARAHARGVARPPLFVRNKAGAALTSAGEQFLPHATTLVQVWERARHQVAVPTGSRAVLAVGCEISLWDPLLLRLAAVDAPARARTWRCAREVGFPQRPARPGGRRRARHRDRLRAAAAARAAGRAADRGEARDGHDRDAAARAAARRTTSTSTGGPSSRRSTTWRFPSCPARR